MIKDDECCGTSSMKGLSLNIGGGASHVDVSFLIIEVIIACYTNIYEVYRYINYIYIYYINYINFTTDISVVKSLNLSRLFFLRSFVDQCTKHNWVTIPLLFSVNSYYICHVYLDTIYLLFIYLFIYLFILLYHNFEIIIAINNW